MKLYQGDSGDFYFGSRPEDEGSKYVGSDDSANYVNLMSAQQANKTNIQLAKDNNDFNMRMWEMNNEYNDPSKQVDRYLAAGINPSAAIANISNGNSSSPVAGSMANAVAGSYDPTAKWNKFNSIVSTVLGGLSSAKEIISQGADIKRLINETSLNKSQVANIDAMTLGQLFQNSKQEETWNNAQEQIKASTHKILAETKLSDTQRDQVLKNISWIDKLNGQEFDKMKAEINNINAQAQGAWNESHVSALRARLADDGINPDSKGIDKFLDLLVNDPSSVGSILNSIFDGLSSSVGNVLEHTIGTLPKKAKGLWNKVSSGIDGAVNTIFDYISGSSRNHKNPRYE